MPSPPSLWSRKKNKTPYQVLRTNNYLIFEGTITIEEGLGENCVKPHASKQQMRIVIQRGRHRHHRQSRHYKKLQYAFYIKSESHLNTMPAYFMNLNLISWAKEVKLQMAQNPWVFFLILRVGGISLETAHTLTTTCETLRHQGTILN